MPQVVGSDVGALLCKACCGLETKLRSLIAGLNTPPACLGPLHAYVKIINHYYIGLFVAARGRPPSSVLTFSEALEARK